MTHLKQLSLLAITGLMSISLFANTPIKNAKTETVLIQGNSPACKKTIEQAGSQKRVSQLTWDAATRTARLTYNTQATTKDAVLKRIALAGFDNEVYNAPLSSYLALGGECRYKGVPKSMEHSGADSDKVMDKASSKLEPLYKAYFAVNDALVQSDTKTAEQKAGELYNLVQSVQMNTLSTDEHATWMQLMKQLDEQAAALKTAAGLEKQRVAFAVLSESIYPLLKASQLPYKVYYNKCPMFNGGATWLSQEESIQNPYYGSKMLTCGSTKAVIGQ